MPMTPNNRLNLGLKGYTFVLGSSSPRRKEILTSNLGVDKFTIVKSTFEENLPKGNYKDVEYVTRTAEHKIDSIMSRLSSTEKHVLLVADTIVSCAGEIFEKPETKENQRKMLHSYRDNPNMIKVITSVHVCKVGLERKIEKHLREHEITNLRFDPSLSDSQLQDYIETGEGLHVAGGFMYQSKGSLLFQGIEGDYFNVVGLPAAKTYRMLEALDL